MSRVLESPADAREHSPTLHLLAVPHVMSEPTWNVMVMGMVSARDAISSPDSFSNLTAAQALARGSAALGIDHHQRREARHFVDLLGDGDAFLDVLEAHQAAVLGDDRAVCGSTRRASARLDGFSSATRSVAP